MPETRILHVIGRMDRAGAETMVMNLYRSIDRSRFQFDFVSFAPGRGDYDDEIEALGGRIVRITDPSPLRRFAHLRRLLREGPWAIVHSHTLFSSGLHLLAARLEGIPVRIAHSHSTADANSGSLVGRLYQRVSRALLERVPTHYVACGEAAAAYLFPGAKDVMVVPNAIDCDAFIGPEAPVDREAGGRRIRVLQVGRLHPVKNHRLSLDIAEVLRDAGDTFEMQFAGDGELRTEIEAAVRDRGLGDLVTVLGVRADIASLMHSADVMLMPSHHEGFPVVLVESQAAGLPAVVSDAISPEVDLGLGLVEFVPLEAPSAKWAAMITQAAVAPVPDADARRRTLVDRGFSAAAGAQRLESMYTGQ